MIYIYYYKIFICFLKRKKDMKYFNTIDDIYNIKMMK